MANVNETPSWDAGVYQLESTDPVLGGADGISNRQAKQLANRTSYLKAALEALTGAGIPVSTTDARTIEDALAAAGGGSVVVRQAVQAGKVDQNGQAAFLTGTSEYVPNDSSVYATSGGYYNNDSTYAPDKAFDNSLTTRWISSQTGTAISGVSYVGQNYGAGNGKHNRRVVLTAFSDPVNNLSSVKIQRSADGVSWIDVATAALNTAANSVTTIDLPASASAQYWRVLANANLSSGRGWSLVDVVFSNKAGVDGSAPDVVDVLADADDPLVLAFAAGLDAAGKPVDHRPDPIASNILGAWSGLPLSATVYLYVERDASTGALSFGYSTSAPHYGEVEPATPAAGAHWYNITKGLMQHYTGSAWEPKQRLFVGEADTDAAGVVTDRRTYAILGRYAPGRLANTATTVYHNVGCDLVEAQIMDATAAGGSLRPAAITGLTAHTVTFTIGAGAVEVRPIIKRAF